MPYDTVTDSFHTKKPCSRFSSSKVRFYTENGCFAFLSHPLGGLGQHTMIIGMRIVDFLLVFIELFSVGVTAEALQSDVTDGDSRATFHANQFGGYLQCTILPFPTDLVYHPFTLTTV